MQDELSTFASRTFALPLDLEIQIRQVLEAQYKLSLDDPDKLAQAVLQLSDFYNSNSGEKTPWQQNWCQIAYLSYYLPLNFLRAQAVFKEGQRVGFFDEVKTVIDYGSGLGSGSLPLVDGQREFQFVESSSVARAIHAKLLGESSGVWRENVSSIPSSLRQQYLGVFSYSLTEFDLPMEKLLPNWALDVGSLMIIEPSTRDRGRRLSQLREFLIQRDYSVWSPCLHQQSCPLLVGSKNDWCHDRIHFAQPSWFANIEKKLPMRNQTLTMSYLLVSRRRAPKFPPDSARLVGDLMTEKGKSRQMLCRGPNREFLAWMHKNVNPQELPRGIVVSIPRSSISVSNEVRVSENLEQQIAPPLSSRGQ